MDDLHDEHQKLQDQTKALEREHAEVSQVGDREAHAEHIEHLQENMRQLEEHHRNLERHEATLQEREANLKEREEQIERRQNKVFERAAQLRREAPTRTEK